MLLMPDHNSKLLMPWRHNMTISLYKSPLLKSAQFCTTGVGLTHYGQDNMILIDLFYFEIPFSWIKVIMISLQFESDAFLIGLLILIIGLQALTHWGQLTHICINKLTIIGSDNGLSPSHYLNQCWNIVNWTLRNKLQWNFNWNLNILIQENPSENVVWKMLAILSQPQCVKNLATPLHLCCSPQNGSCPNYNTSTTKFMKILQFSSCP